MTASEGRILCPLCGARWTKAAIRWSEATPVGTREIAYCAACHFGFNHPMPCPAAVTEFYIKSDNYVNCHYNPPELDQRVFRWTARCLEKLLGGKGAILDIGCGRGDFLAAMSRRGWQAAGLEIDPTLAAMVNARDIPCTLGNITEAAIPEQGFDVITFRDVLEHIPAPPQEILAICRGWLKEHGLIYLKVPNLDWIVGPLGKVKKRGFEPLVHLHHFSQRSLSLCLAKAGLQPVWWTLEPPSAGSLKMNLGYMALKAIEKITRGQCH